MALKFAAISGEKNSVRSVYLEQFDVDARKTGLRSVVHNRSSTRAYSAFVSRSRFPL